MPDLHAGKEAEKGSLKRGKLSYRPSEIFEIPSEEILQTDGGRAMVGGESVCSGGEILQGSPNIYPAPSRIKKMQDPFPTLLILTKLGPSRIYEPFRGRARRSPGFSTLFERPAAGR